MDSFLQWTNNEMSKNNQKVDTYISTSGVSTKTNQGSCEKSPDIDKTDALSDGSGSDYVLDSDHCESPPNPHCQSPSSPTFTPIDPKKEFLESNEKSGIKIRSLKPLEKTCSTGDLRVYYKQDLKNKVLQLEHRLAGLEKHVDNLDTSNSRRIAKLENTSLMPSTYQILKRVSISLLCSYIVKMRF